MMSTRALAVFLVCLAAAGGFLGAIGFSDDVVDTDRDLGHEEELNETEQDLQEQAAEDAGDRDSLGTIFGFVLGALQTLVSVIGLVFMLPQVLSNLGLPIEVAVFISAPVYVVVGIAFLEFKRGDRLR